jgi:hypothetical protein
MATNRNRLRRGLVVALGFLAVPLTYVAQGSHNFTDVPTGAFYHASVEWIVNRSITGGCGAGIYCPDSPVTRGQMAVFMRSLGLALTPTVQLTNGTLAVIDIDNNATNVVCPGAAYTPTFAQRAVIYAKVGLEGPADFSFWVHPVVSTDNGVTWNNPSGFSNSAEASPPQPGRAAALTSTASHDLTPGVAYRFAIRIPRAFTSPGTGDPNAGWCGLHVEFVNRNPATGPAFDGGEASATSADQRSLVTN